MSSYTSTTNSSSDSLCGFVVPHSLFAATATPGSPQLDRKSSSSNPSSPAFTGTPGVYLASNPVTQVIKPHTFCCVSYPSIYVLIQIFPCIDDILGCPNFWVQALASNR